MGAVSIQLTPRSTAARTAPSERASSCAPQVSTQPAPPNAHAPMPTRLMAIPVRPSGRLGNDAMTRAPLLLVARLTQSACREGSRLTVTPPALTASSPPSGPDGVAQSVWNPASMTFHCSAPTPTASLLVSTVMRSAVVVTASCVVELYWFSAVPYPLGLLTSTHAWVDASQYWRTHVAGRLTPLLLPSGESWYQYTSVRSVWMG